MGHTSSGAISIPALFRRLFPASPGRLFCLCAAAALVTVADAICFPSELQPSALAVLYLAGTPIFSGLLAAWVMRLRGSTLHLLNALASLYFVAGFFAVLLKLGLPPSSDTAVDATIGIAYLIGVGILIQRGFRSLQSRRRRAAATVGAIFATLSAGQLVTLNYEFWRLSEQVRPFIGRAHPQEPQDTAPEIEVDKLWEAQPELIEKQILALAPRKAGTTNVYAVAIAGAGTQALFGREAHAALDAIAAHFGPASRGGVLLSNAAADQMQSPLATRGNLGGIAKKLGEKANHTQDLLFVYLTSHGSRTAELSSELANYQSVQPISSVSTAQALKESNIPRRIVVISACYAASWIPALANDDAIVITAAAKDRTSFGCDDSRRLTVFGEAFLGSLASQSISLSNAFEDAKRKIAAQETKEGVMPSQPQAYVGRNMTALWHGRLHSADH